MIQLEDVVVDFGEGEDKVRAVDHANLHIEKGDIYGIVGFSGAGKSTLVRTINFLQRPTSGDVYVKGVHLNSLPIEELRNQRKKIGMIFQHFNLMNSRTIIGNVAYPLKRSSLSKEEINKKAMHLLKLVGIEEKAYNYPRELSGGQKQRVGIARALANDPDILLCDEATSALDPKTTTSILELLKQLNEDMGLTIVLITHQMDVVKQICNKMAVMDSGRIVETGSILNVFAKTKEPITKQFINTASQLDKTIQALIDSGEFQKFPENSQLVKLSYIGSSATEPLLVTVYENFQVKTNILYGNVENLDNTPFGNLLVLLEGKAEAIEASKEFLISKGVLIETLKKEG